MAAPLAFVVALLAILAGAQRSGQENKVIMIETPQAAVAASADAPATTTRIVGTTEAVSQVTTAGEEQQATKETDTSIQQATSSAGKLGAEITTKKEQDSTKQAAKESDAPVESAISSTERVRTEAAQKEQNEVVDSFSDEEDSRSNAQIVSELGKLQPFLLSRTSCPDCSKVERLQQAMPKDASYQEHFGQCVLVARAEGPCGSVIDSYDAVMRFNKDVDRQSGLKKDTTGTKATHWVMADHVPIESISQFSKKAEAEHHYDHTTIFHRLYSMEHKLDASLDRFADDAVKSYRMGWRPLDWNWINQISKDLTKLGTTKQRQYPTTGFLGFLIMKDRCDTLDLWGFDAGEGYTNDNGAWDRHPMEVEHDLIQQLAPNAKYFDRKTCAQVEANHAQTSKEEAAATEAKVAQALKAEGNVGGTTKVGQNIEEGGSSDPVKDAVVSALNALKSGTATSEEKKLADLKNKLDVEKENWNKRQPPPLNTKNKQLS